MRLICGLLVASVPAICLSQTASPPASGATTGIVGAWRAESASPTMPWTAVLRVQGRTVIGAVSSCSSNGPVEIFQGHVEGRTVSFKCRSGDGARTLTLSGTIDGDAIEFTWNKHVIENGISRPDDVMFGDASPRPFKATRSSDTSKAVADLAAKASGPMAVSFRRVLEAAGEPRNWLSYSGNHFGHRHSALTAITPSSVKDLELVWLRQTPTQPNPVGTPLVVDGVMYTVVPNEVAALNAATGRVLWTYAYKTGGHAAVRAFDPATGEKKWEFRIDDAWFSAGVLTTAADVLFTGTTPDFYSDPEAARLAGGYFYALDARTGQQLWKMSLAGPVHGNPITYEAGGGQYVSISAGNTLFTFGFRR